MKNMKTETKPTPEQGTKKTAHTPTPWKITGGFLQREIHSTVIPIEVARLQGTDSEQQANAAFIVRAVNSHEALLEALKKCVYLLDANAIAIDGKPNGHIHVAQARHTIAQAEGKE